MLRSRLLTLAFTALLAAGCARPAAPVASHAKAPTPAARDVPAPMPEGAPREALAWADLSPETFVRARAERRYVVMDGSAEWCHWCHVMEATTYHDPAVRKLLAERFIAVKVDVDARPDVLERYADWGWPATVVFSPDGREIGKHRGYIAPDDFVALLREVVESGLAEHPDAGATNRAANEPRANGPRAPLSEETLLWIQRATDAELDGFWDADEGGWGNHQKAPMGWDNAWTLWKAERGDEEARRRAVFTLDKQSALIDPVFGGIYQYSAASDWKHAHYEKLMTFQAPAIENYAVAYRLTGDERQLSRARIIHAYVERFLKAPLAEGGGFYTTQDADLNAHDRTKRFMSGHDYYARGDSERVQLGIPRVDTHEYGRENGLAIGAYATLYEVTRDPAVLASAEAAARRVLATHPTERGGITHDVVAPEAKPKVLYLADNAAFGWGLARLYEVTRNAMWLTASRKIADFMLAELQDETTGGLFASTLDPDAVGVFAKRRVPFEDNVMALRLLARLSRATHDARYVALTGRVLRAISTPEQIKDRGRMLGDYLLALEETKGVR